MVSLPSRRPVQVRAGLHSSLGKRLRAKQLLIPFNPKARAAGTSEGLLHLGLPSGPSEGPQCPAYRSLASLGLGSPSVMCGRSGVSSSSISVPGTRGAAGATHSLQHWPCCALVVCFQACQAPGVLKHDQAALFCGPSRAKKGFLERRGMHVFRWFASGSAVPQQLPLAGCQPPAKFCLIPRPGSGATPDPPWPLGFFVSHKPWPH